MVAGFELHAADTSLDGPVLVTIHPRAISVHRYKPEGSPRNTFPTTVTRHEHYGDRIRLQTAGPLHLTAEITPGAADALSLQEGNSIWLSIKATEVGLVGAKCVSSRPCRGLTLFLIAAPTPRVDYFQQLGSARLDIGDIAELHVTGGVAATLQSGMIPGDRRPGMKHKGDV